MAKGDSSGRRGLQVLLLTLLVLIIGFALTVRYAYTVETKGKALTLDGIYRLGDEGRIISASLLDEDAQIVGKSCSTPVGSQITPQPRPVAPTAPTGPAAPTAAAGAKCPGEEQDFYASYPRSDVATSQLIERLTESGARVEIGKQTNKAVAKLIVTFVFPLIILANLFGIIFLSRSGESSIGDIVGFGKIGKNKSKKRQTGTGVTFADVAGVDESVTELKEVIDYLKDPAKFKEYGAAAPKGVLLFGPPGCGKTLMARAVAGESGVPFFSISGAEFVESLVGVGAARVRDLFRQIREAAPAIVFIDEIDAVGRKREGEGSSGGEREQTINQLLVEMDGFEVSAGIVVMAATNRPDILDPALLRPGRFDRHVTLETPDVHGRQEILELHARGKPLSPDVEFESLARKTAGFTGADLSNVINEAALLAIREGSQAQIQQSHLSEAVQRVLHGPQRRGRLMTGEERKRIAFHESGHAMVAAAFGHQSDTPRISIVARGRGLGQSSVSTESERVLFTRSEMESELAVAMAGIAAEELMFGESSTTSEDDIDKATEQAREMVGVYGMSTEIGRMRLLSKDGGFLGTDAVMDTVSGQTMQQMDEQVKLLISSGEQKATEILTQHRDQLQKIAEILEAEETLEGRALQNLLAPIQPEVFPVFAQNGGQTGAATTRRTPAKRRGI